MSEDKIWWTVFVVSFVSIAMAETFLPFRRLRTSTPRRWANNSILLTVSSVAVGCVYQFTGIALAFGLRANAYGALNLIHLSYSVRFLIAFAALDLTAYASHRLFHALAPLWRLHQIHHSETDLDLVSGLRFHPIEALLTHGLLLVSIALIGAPPGTVAFWGLVVVAADFFTHANLHIPNPADRFLRWLIVTPGMHRVHHSEPIPMQNANFATIFSIWDRLFGTYNSALSAAEEHVRFGVAEIAEGSKLSATALLLLPFHRSRKPGPLAASPHPSPVTPSALRRSRSA